MRWYRLGLARILCFVRSGGRVPFRMSLVRLGPDRLERIIVLVLREHGKLIATLILLVKLWCWLQFLFRTFRRLLRLVGPGRLPTIRPVPLYS